MSTLKPVAPADDFGFDEQPSSSSSEVALDWRRYLHAVVRRWWLILLCVVVATVSAGLFTSRQPKLYKSSVSLIIDLRSSQVLTGVQDVVDTSARGWSLGNYFETEFEVMKSRSVARSAAERLDLAFDDRRTGLTGVTDPNTRARRVDSLDLANLVLGRYTIEPDKNSNVVRIGVVDEDPKFAADLANAVADAYLDANLGKRVDNTRDASEWLTTQHEELRQKLRQSENGLLKFMADNNVLNASISSQLDEVTQRLKAFNANLATEEAGGIRDVLNVKALEQVRADPTLIDTLPEIQTAGVVNQLKTRLIEVRGLEMELSARYLGDHPKMKLIAEQKVTLQADLEREVAALLTSMERAKNSRQSSIDGLKAALAEERTKEARLNKLLIDYERMKRERDTDAKLFDMVTGRIKEAGLTGAQPFNNVRVLDKAIPPSAPFKPNMQQALLGALIAGFVLGVGIALLLELADTTVKSQEDLERLVDVPFLGVLPLIAINGEKRPGDRAAELEAMRERDLFLLKNPRSAVAECARFIRTNLMFMSPDRPLKTLVVTSPAPQEGKSTTAVMTAITMAQAGSRTLIVDTDLRKPRLHRVFGIDGDIGLSAVLLGESSIENAVRKTEVPNLDVLVCGALPPNPSEILLSDKFRELVRDLAKRYDRVIFDAPPMGPVTDPAILGTLVDGVLLVTKCEKTTKASVKQAMRALKDANTRVFGVILNDVDVSSKRYGASYYSYYRRNGAYYGERDATNAGGG
ncbi:MAG: polysaccharide biosynthesis tyrosine autokinase [Deltaproteobacteria bacterium]|nr:polysaccharide biosynthesis tyrosine autokinase [Deltaproteobacteria bacterium]